MFSSLLTVTMNLNNLFLSGILVWIIQLLLADFLAINTVRPDFIVILVLYWSLRYGRLIGIVFGFFIGLLVDLSGTSSFFGLSPLTYTITGYLGGNLIGKYSTMSLLYFSLAWIGVLAFHFLVFSLVQYQHIFGVNTFLFWSKWFGTCLYTLCFAGILQFIYPLHKIN